MPFPDENLCDLVVFDSLYKEGRNLWPSPDEDLLHFLGEARQQPSSQFGLSFDFENRHKLRQTLDDGSAKALIDDYWHDNIHHYGMMDINPRSLISSDEVYRTFELFKAFYKLLDAQATPRGETTLVFFGFSPVSQQWVSSFPRFFSAFRPDIFVVRGHNSLVNHNDPGCKIAPPTLMGEHSGFPFSLSTAHTAVNEVASSKYAVNTSLAVSVSMAGRWNRPRSYPNTDVEDYRLFKSCTALPSGLQQFGNIYEVCSSNKFIKFVAGKYLDGYSYSIPEGLSFTYDTPRSLKEKATDARAIS
ncbi:uncharacterized protein LOC144159846 [Haemaphysalis longicornis]